MLPVNGKPTQTTYEILVRPHRSVCKWMTPGVFIMVKGALINCFSPPWFIYCSVFKLRYLYIVGSVWAVQFFFPGVHCGSLLEWQFDHFMAWFCFLSFAGSKEGMWTNWSSFAFERFRLIFVEGNFWSPEECPAGDPIIFGAEEYSTTVLRLQLTSVLM